LTYYSCKDAVGVRTHLLYFGNLVESILMAVFVETHTFWEKTL